MRFIIALGKTSLNT